MELNPDFAGAYYNLGNAWKGQGQLAEAIHCYRQAIERKPNYAEAYNNLGSALKDDGRAAEAVACFQRALLLKPDLAEARHNLVRRLHSHGSGGRRGGQRSAGRATVARRGRGPLPPGQRIDGRAAFGRCGGLLSAGVALRPDYVEAHNNLGAALKDQRQFAAAAVCYRTALRYQPDCAEVYNNLAGIFWELGDLDQALPYFRRALELKPDYADAHYNLGVLLKDCGQGRRGRRLLPTGPGAAARFQDLPQQPGLPALFLSRLRREIDLRRASPLNQRHAAPLEKSARPHGNERFSPDRRLRVGYVSPDFRVHCQALFTVPLFSSHDHRGFEIFCYSDVDRPDDVTTRLRGYADAWREISGRSDEQVAELVRSDRIDILVDLTMHMEGNRVLVFARKPVPVQVCWLAYPATTGLTAIDYRLTDPHLDPPGRGDRYYAEESIRLDDSFWCYDLPESEPAVNRLPALERGHVTFGCLNNFCKINPPVLKLWAQVLGAVDRSRLMILAPKGAHRQTTLDLLAREGIDPERITFVGGRPRRQYLELYHTNRPRAGHVPLQRPYHEHGFLLDGRAGRHARGPNVRGAGGSVALDESRPAGADRPRRRTIRADRRGAGGRFAAAGRSPRRVAGADAVLAVDGRPAFRPQRRSGVPGDAAPLVCSAAVSGVWQVFLAGSGRKAVTAHALLSS